MYKMGVSLLKIEKTRDQQFRKAERGPVPWQKELVLTEVPQTSEGAVSWGFLTQFVLGEVQDCESVIEVCFVEIKVVHALLEQVLKAQSQLQRSG